MGSKKMFYKVSFFLVILGAINLGIYGLTGIDFVDYVFAGDLNIVAEIIDTLVGIGGIYLLYKYFSKTSAK